MAVEQFVLIGIIALIAVVLAYWLGKLKSEFEWKRYVPQLRKEAADRSRAVIGGQFSEQLAAFLPGFKYKPTECRFVGKPVDFIVFEGMDEKDIQSVVFVEVKSGQAALSTQERKLRDAIRNNRVRWEQYTIPEKVTK